MKVYVGVDENGEEDVKDEEGLGRINEDQVDGKVAATSGGDGENVEEVQGDKGEDVDTENKSEGGDEGDKRDKEDDGEKNKEENVGETKKAGDTENKSEGGDEGDKRDKKDDGEQNKEEHMDETKKAGDVGVHENGVVGGNGDEAVGNTRGSEESKEEKDKDGKPVDTEGSVRIEENKTVESGTQQAGDSVDGANKAIENTASEKEDVVEVVEKGESIEETNGDVVNDVDPKKSLLEGKTSEEILTEEKHGEVRF